MKHRAAQGGEGGSPSLQVFKWRGALRDVVVGMVGWGGVGILLRTSL